MDKPCHIVLTTIRHPAILNDLYDNIRKHGHLNEVKVWVVGDRKTPASAGVLAHEISQKGLETVYFDILNQDAWGKAFPLYDLIPYNTDGRRVFGYLKALEEDCQIMIAMDDDNFPTDDDLIGGHQRSGQKWPGPVLREAAQYHNVCEYLVVS